MTAWCVVCERDRANMGRNRNQTYINVLVSTKRLDGVDSVSEWLTANPGHPWADSQFNEFIIEITEMEYNEFNDGTNPLTWDGVVNEPRWQQQTAGSGQTKDFGHWTDPRDTGTTWNPDVALPDDRWIVRIYDDDPGTTGVHVGTEEFDEGTSGSTVLRYLKLFNSDDTASSTNAQNQRTEIGGYLMDFDFTSGVSTFNVAIDMPGSILWPSNGQYRIIGPSDEKQYIANIYGKTLRVPVE